MTTKTNIVGCFGSLSVVNRNLDINILLSERRCESNKSYTYRELNTITY